MAIADGLPRREGLPSRDEAACAFDHALADLHAYLTEEDAIVERQLAGTDERRRQLREELALVERGREALAPRRRTSPSWAAGAARRRRPSTASSTSRAACIGSQAARVAGTPD